MSGQRGEEFPVDAEMTGPPLRRAAPSPPLSFHGYACCASEPCAMPSSGAYCPRNHQSPDRRETNAKCLRKQTGERKEGKEPVVVMQDS